MTRLASLAGSTNGGSQPLLLQLTTNLVHNAIGGGLRVVVHLPSATTP